MKNMQNAYYIMEISLEITKSLKYLNTLKKQQSSTFNKVQDSNVSINNINKQHRITTKNEKRPSNHTHIEPIQKRKQTNKTYETHTNINT